jgi:rhodanese-related sulfurtransferase
MNTPFLSVLIVLGGFCFSLFGAEKQAISPAQPAPEIKMKRVGVEEFAKLRTNTNNVVLDVRTEKEFKAGHIPGAINIDVNAPDFEAQVGKLGTNKTFLVHCAAGVRSRRACGRLDAAGFQNLIDLAPGFNGWQQAGQPVTKPAEK